MAWGVRSSAGTGDEDGHDRDHDDHGGDGEPDIGPGSGPAARRWGVAA
jgi:hypothetical protein